MREALSKSGNVYLDPESEHKSNERRKSLVSNARSNEPARLNNETPLSMLKT